MNIIKVLSITLLLASCAGRSPNPCATARPGDTELPCSYLLSEMQEIEGNVKRLLPDSQKTGKNVALGATGALFIVPLFFMDFSEAEKIELEAYQARYNHLVRLYNGKCSVGNAKPIAEMKISLEEKEEKNK